MHKYFLIACFTFLLFQSFAQTIKPANNYLKISGGQVSFGNEVSLGYSIALEASHYFIKNSRWGLAKLLLGGEMIFEDGSRNDYTYNYTTRNIILWPKGSYYPLKKVLPGFNIQLGPTVGYTHNATTRIADDDGNSIFEPQTISDNRLTLGYRISTGIEFNVMKKFLLGFRLDWSNTTNSDINTLLGLKAGFRF